MRKLYKISENAIIHLLLTNVGKLPYMHAYVGCHTG